MDLMSSSRRKRLINEVLKLKVLSITDEIHGLQNGNPHWVGAKVEYKDYALVIFTFDMGSAHARTYSFTLEETGGQLVDNWSFETKAMSSFMGGKYEDKNEETSKKVITHYKLHTREEKYNNSVVVKKREKIEGEHPFVYDLLKDYED